MSEGAQKQVTLERLREDLISFKKSHPLKSPPENLWIAALGLVGSHGLSKISKEVGLDFGELRKRLRQENGLEQKASFSFSEETRTSKMEFVELSSPNKKRTIDASRTAIKVRIKTGLGSTFSIQSRARSSRQWERIFTGWLRAEQTIRGDKV